MAAPATPVKFRSRTKPRLFSGTFCCICATDIRVTGRSYTKIFKKGMQIKQELNAKLERICGDDIHKNMTSDIICSVCVRIINRVGNSMDDADRIKAAFLPQSYKKPRKSLSKRGSMSHSLESLNTTLDQKAHAQQITRERSIFEASELVRHAEYIPAIDLLWDEEDFCKAVMDKVNGIRERECHFICNDEQGEDSRDGLQISNVRGGLTVTDVDLACPKISMVEGGDAAQQLINNASKQSPKRNNAAHFTEIPLEEIKEEPVDPVQKGNETLDEFPDRVGMLCGPIKVEQDTNLEEKPHLCEVCHKSFTEAGHLHNHQETHTGEMPYQCEVCHTFFNRASNLRSHQRMHTGERPYQCVVCPKTFTHACSLRTHQRMHTGKRPHQCGACYKFFSRASNLHTHQRTHTGERPYQCEVCQNSFMTSSNLRRHQQTHTGERHYQCELCPKSFASSSALCGHQRMHTGERPYQSVVCPKSFTHASSLRTHQRMHTGKSPHQCGACYKFFSRASNLHRHQRTHTGENRNPIVRL